MTAMNPFATIPAPSSGIKWQEVNGSLLILQPTGVELGIQTTYGPSDAVKANIWVVDGPNAGEIHDDTLVFPKLLQSQLKSRINQVVLGRIGQGQVKKAGQDAPWLLEEPTAQDVQMGMQAWERIQSGGQTAPAQAQQQPPAQQQTPAATTFQPQAQQFAQAPAQQAPVQQAPAQQWAPQQTQQQAPTQAQYNDTPPF